MKKTKEFILSQEPYTDYVIINGVKYVKEAFGIETEPEYKITKEQIRLIEHQSVNEDFGQVARDMREWFPEAFKEDKVELIPGSWYMYPAEPKFITYVKENHTRYGIRSNGNWFDMSDKVRDTRGYRLATPEEVTQALTKEAVKRYKVGDYVKCLYTKTGVISGNGICKVSKERFYLDPYNQLWMYSSDNRNIQVFNNGVWATIAETITKEDAEKELGKKILN